MISDGNRTARISPSARGDSSLRSTIARATSGWPSSRRVERERSAWQRKGDVRIRRLRAQLPSTGGDHHELPPTHRIRARRRIARRRQFRLPQLLPRRLVERAELLILRGGNEYEPTRRNDRPAIELGTGRRDPSGRQRGELAQCDAPSVLAGVEVDGAESV